MRQLPIACALIPDRRGRVLLLRREDRSMADLDGLWELPGGKVEFGEEPVAAAIREVQEETGLDVSVKAMVPLVYTNVWDHPAGPRQVFLLTYVCGVNRLDGSAESGEDSAPAGCAWFSPGEIPGLKTIRGTVEIIDSWLESLNPPRGAVPQGSLLPGKIPPSLLCEFLSRMKAASPGRAIVGPASGEDAAVIATDSGSLILAADPITFVTGRPARYCVLVNANDIAAMGGVPRYLILVVLLPEGAGWTPADLLALADEVREACLSIGVEVIGGHTEVTAAVKTPVLVGQMTGIPGPAGILRTNGARPGDVLVLTRPPGIEGTAILAGEKTEAIAMEFGADFAARCADFIENPGISVVPEAQLLASLPAGCDGTRPIHALHDLTEGGLYAGAWEMAESSKTGLVLDMDAVTILPETLELCRFLEIDPAGLISSGALIAAVDPARVEEVLRILEPTNPNAAAVGRFTRREEGIRAMSAGSVSPMGPPGADEISKVL